MFRACHRPRVPYLQCTPKDACGGIRDCSLGIAHRYQAIPQFRRYPVRLRTGSVCGRPSIWAWWRVLPRYLRIGDYRELVSLKLRLSALNEGALAA
jgi:hypothetical protein